MPPFQITLSGDYPRDVMLIGAELQRANDHANKVNVMLDRLTLESAHQSEALDRIETHQSEVKAALKERRGWLRDKVAAPLIVAAVLWFVGAGWVMYRASVVVEQAAKSVTGK